MSEERLLHSTDDPAVSRPLRGTDSGSATRSRGVDRYAASPHAHRFRIATGVLVGLAIGALIIALAVGAAGRPAKTINAPWSDWAPSESGTLGARDIADHIAPLYRISAVDQLAVVTVVNLESAAAQAAAASAAANGTTTSPTGALQVAVRENPASGQVSVLGGNTIAYNLCGIGGKNCAIGVGPPSTNRLLLLRREALELAMYTFKYIGGVSNVVAILPPGHTQQTSQLSQTPPTKTQPTTSKPLDVAVLFQRQELAPLLSLPLRATLPEQLPPTVAQMQSAREAGLVDQVTGRGLFSEQLQQAQDGTNLIVLNPLPPQ
jgi:hypothetical protein